MTARTADARAPVVFLGALAGFGPISIDMYLPALPAMRDALGATTGNVQLTLSAFVVGIALGQLVYGPLSDCFGRKPVLVGGIALYAAATLLCALATSVEALIAFRFVHAFGGGAGVVLSRAIVMDRFEGDYAARAMSLTMMVAMTAPLFAPFIGGYLSVWFGWRMIFYFLTAFGLLCLVAAVFAYDETLAADRRRPLNLGQMVAAYLRVLRHRQAASNILCRASITASMLAFLAGAPFVYITLHGVAPENFAFVFSVNVIGVIAGSYLNSRLVVRFGLRTMLRVGLSIMVLSAFASLAVAWTGFGGLTGIVVSMFCFIAPINLVTANTTAGALSYFPDLAGTASALSGAVSFLAGGLSSLALGALYDGTPIPMAAIMLCCALIAAVAYRMSRD